MAHTSVSSGPVTGIGDWAAGSGGDWLTIDVSTTGFARFQNAGPPLRLFEAGWFALGDGMPDGTPNTFYDAPVFIEFEHMLYSTFAHQQPPANPVGVDTLHYELSPGVTAEFRLYTFF